MALAGTGAELMHLTPRPTKDLWGSNYLNIAGCDVFELRDSFKSIHVILLVAF